MSLREHFEGIASFFGIVFVVLSLLIICRGPGVVVEEEGGKRYTVQFYTTDGKPLTVYHDVKSWAMLPGSSITLNTESGGILYSGLPFSIHRNK